MYSSHSLLVLLLFFWKCNHSLAPVAPLMGFAARNVAQNAGRLVGKQVMQKTGGNVLSKMPMAPKPPSIGRTGGGGDANVFNRMKPMPLNGGKQGFQQMWRAEGNLLQEAMQTLRQRVQRLNPHMEMLAEYRQALQKKAMFGLDEMPTLAKHAQKYGAEVVRVPSALLRTKRVDGNMIRRMLTYTREGIYNGIWRAANAIKRLPPAAHKTLLTIATIANIGHTMDEYWQVLLLSIIDGDQVGIGFPKSLSELGDGLNNFWWDAWPDFAFGVPVAFFAFNPPAAILMGAYFTLMEYVGKKVIGEVLKDYVWTSKIKPVEAMNTYRQKELPKTKVFEADIDDDEDDNEEEPQQQKYEMPLEAEAGTDGNEGDENVTLDKALLDSQKNSNLYKYFALNSMRSIYVLAISVQMEFFKQLDSDEVQKQGNNNLSEFAQQTKEKMAKRKELMQKTVEILENNEQVKKVMMPSGQQQGGKQQIDVEKHAEFLAKKAEEFEHHILPSLKQSERNGDQQKMHELKAKIARMNEQIEAEMKPPTELQEMAREIAHFMICDDKCATRNGGKPEMKRTQMQDWARTMARLITFGSTDMATGAQQMTKLAMTKNEHEGEEMEPANEWHPREEEWLEKPKELHDGEVLLPECAPTMTQCVMNYLMGKPNTMAMGNMIDGRKQINAESVNAQFGGGKRWAVPFCGMRQKSPSPLPPHTNAGMMGHSHLKAPVEVPAEAANEFELFPVYDEVEIEELNEGFKLYDHVMMPMLAANRAGKKWMKKLHQTAKQTDEHIGN